MKGFKRQNQLFSLCGLNCGLCPMFLNKNCPGCGGGEGNQACKIARCSIEHGGVEYCFQCSEYPCERYDHIDDFDSFITHRRRKADLEKARKKRAEWDAKVKDLERRYREEENTEIHEMVHAANLTPEQLAELIRKSATFMPQVMAAEVKEDGQYDE